MKDHYLRVCVASSLERKIAKMMAPPSGGGGSNQEEDENSCS